MATVDYFSSFFETDRLYDLLTTTVIKKLKADLWHYMQFERKSRIIWIINPGNQRQQQLSRICLQVYLFLLEDKP